MTLFIAICFIKTISPISDQPSLPASTFGVLNLQKWTFVLSLCCCIDLKWGLSSPPQILAQNSSLSQHLWCLLWWGLSGWCVGIASPHSGWCSSTVSFSSSSNISTLFLSSPTVAVFCWLSKAFMYFYAEFGQNLPQWIHSPDSGDSCELLEYE